MSIGIHGSGKIETVGTNTVRLVINADTPSYYANRLSVYNGGDTVLYVLVNCTIEHFNTNVATAIPIAPKAAFAFVGDGRPPLFNICMKTTSGTCEVYIGAF